MQPIITVINQKAVTTSREVAEIFGRKHYNLLRDIEDTIADLELTDAGREFSELNFELANYTDAQGKPRPQYLLTKDAFTILAFGFTGSKAMEFKVAYINAFNQMQELLNGARCAPHPTPVPASRALPDGSLSASFFLALQAALDSGDVFLRKKNSKNTSDQRCIGYYSDREIRITKPTKAYQIYARFVKNPVGHSRFWERMEEEGGIDPAVRYMTINGKQRKHTNRRSFSRDKLRIPEA